MNTEEYNSLIESIFRRFPSVQTSSFGDAYKPGLQHIEDFNAALGNPVSEYRTIHVAGTNGKGSVANMLASALAGAGLKVGLYTSPHILDFRERMRVLDGRPDDRTSKVRLVSKEYVYGFLTNWNPRFDEMQLSFFEITTGLAFKWFADEKVDIAVIEVGLGGRLDSTNIITPELSIVTSIGLDHCDLLGDTLGKIAFEKAGIFKRGIPALVGETHPETEPVFRERFEAVNASTLTFADRTEPAFWHLHNDILEKMDLRGEYQVKNLRTSLVAIDILRKRWENADAETFSKASVRLGDSAGIAESLIHTAARMDFHGRWERIHTHPDIICDIGHNSAALTYNFGQLKGMLECKEYSSLTIVYGIMADKNLDGILPLFPKNATWIFTTPKNRRAMPAKEILSKYTAYCNQTGRPAPAMLVEDDVRRAVQTALDLARKDLVRPLIYVGGSTFVVCEAVSD